MLLGVLVFRVAVFGVLVFGVLALRALLLGVRGAGGGRHQEPPEVDWLLPELELTPEPELRPLELELPEFELPLLELPELELPVLELPELEFELVPEEPVLLEDVPLLVDEPVDVEDVAVLWVDPGRARVTTPAAATLARVTAVVVERTLARPRSRAAMARRTLSRSALLMSPILRSRIRSLLQETSPLAMRACAVGQPSAARLSGKHEGVLKPRFPRGRAGYLGRRDRSCVLRRLPDLAECRAAAEPSGRRVSALSGVDGDPGVDRQRYSRVLTRVDISAAGVHNVLMLLYRVVSAITGLLALAALGLILAAIFLDFRSFALSRSALG